MKSTITARTMALSKEILETHMQDFNSLSIEGQHQRISDMLIAMSYGQAVLAHEFLKATPGEFGSRMGKFLTEAMGMLKEREMERLKKEVTHGTRTSAAKESLWD